MKKKSDLIKGIIIGIIVGILCFTAISSKKITASEKAYSSHGRGVYLNFEYEIVGNVYDGRFVVIKDNNNGGRLSVAGIQ